MQQIFKDQALDKKFREDGYVIIRLLHSDEVMDAQNACQNLNFHTEHKFFAGLMSEDKNFKRNAHQLIVRALASKLENHLIDYRPLYGSLILKKPNEDNPMRVHQDWSVVDEKQYTSLNVWTPLVDVDENNGTMYILPGSQVFISFRGANIPYSCAPIAGMPYNEFKCCTIAAGEALIYAGSLIHRSGPNYTDRERIAMLLAMVPKATRPLHYHFDKMENKVKVYAIDSDFFIEYDLSSGALPTGLELMEKVSPEFKPITPKMIEKLRKKESWFSRIFSS